jgi:hypothetical protein
LAARKSTKAFPSKKFNQMDIQYAESIEDAFENNFWISTDETVLQRTGPY